MLLFLGLPNVYELYRVYLIGNAIPDSGILAIASQWQFVGLVVEVFQEATVLAAFFFVGSQIRSSSDIQTDRTKSVLTLILAGSFIFSVGVFLFRGAFTSVIGISPEIQSQTQDVLAVSIFSVPFTLMSATVVVLFQSLRKRGTWSCCRRSSHGWRMGTPLTLCSRQASKGLSLKGRGGF